MAITFTQDIRGVPQVRKMLRGLPGALQQKILQKTMRESASRIYANVLLNFSGRRIQERTGRTVAAFERQKVTSRRRKDRLTVGVALPRRSELGLDANEPAYPPAVLEYGSKSRRIRERRMIRDGMDAVAQREAAFMIGDARRMIEREAKKLSRQ